MPSRSPCFLAVWRLLALHRSLLSKSRKAFLCAPPGASSKPLLLVCLASGLVLVLHGTRG